MGIHAGLCSAQRVVGTTTGSDDGAPDDDDKKDDDGDDDDNATGKKDASLLENKDDDGDSNQTLKDLHSFSLPLMWNGHLSQMVCNDAVLDVLTCGPVDGECPED